MATNLHYPFQFDGRGRTRDAQYAVWIRGLVEQVLFTAPGERVNRPDFGAGLGELVFAPEGDETAAATKLLVQSSLLQWLGDVIEVQAVRVDRREGALHVLVRYRDRQDQLIHDVEFSRQEGL